MVEIKLNETIKYKGIWYYANSTIEVEDKDAGEMSKYGEVTTGIIPTPVDDEKRNGSRRKSK